MWYDIFIEDEFVQYFSNENNTFTIEENGQKVLAPTFSRFADVVIGVSDAWLISDLISESYIADMKKNKPDYFHGYTFCLENRYSQEDMYLHGIWHSIPTDQSVSRYAVDLEKLNAEQCAVLLMYPFWSRMGGGSFEISFQEDGRLKKYLLAVKEKREKGKKGSV